MLKTRFAPSPTGYLHIGGLRTALFNWLWARRNGGQFLLRVEDTDLTRNSKEALDAILQAFDWVGRDYDGRGYISIKEIWNLYREYIDRFLKRGVTGPYKDGLPLTKGRKPKD